VDDDRSNVCEGLSFGGHYWGRTVTSSVSGTERRSHQVGVVMNEQLVATGDVRLCRRPDFQSSFEKGRVRHRPLRPGQHRRSSLSTAAFAMWWASSPERYGARLDDCSIHLNPPIPPLTPRSMTCGSFCRADRDQFVTGFGLELGDKVTLSCGNGSRHRFALRGQAGGELALSVDHLERTASGVRQPQDSIDGFNRTKEEILESTDSSSRLTPNHEAIHATPPPAS